MTEYAIALGVIFAVNLLPALGPPTWAVLVFFYLTFGLEPLILVPIGALAAASGRFVLATVTRRMRSRFGTERLDDLDAVEEALTRNPARGSRCSHSRRFRRRSSSWARVCSPFLCCR